MSLVVDPSVLKTEMSQPHTIMLIMDVTIVPYARYDEIKILDYHVKKCALMCIGCADAHEGDTFLHGSLVFLTFCAW